MSFTLPNQYNFPGRFYQSALLTTPLLDDEKVDKITEDMDFQDFDLTKSLLASIAYRQRAASSKECPKAPSN